MDSTGARSSLGMFHRLQLDNDLSGVDHDEEDESSEDSDE